ncbi:MAG: sel1 repeat family protein [Candidatus Methanomethylophilaceae archaeon]|nr:sel1 repeat family protein [Candidatus Methanomethylophilaceae archaeon]
MYDDENKLAEEMRPLTEDEMKTLTVLAEKGDGKAQLRLGQAFLFEKVVPDYSKAYRYFRKAVEQDVVRAYYYLGELYYHGWGIARNLDSAIECFETAADDGDMDAEYALGMMYLYGNDALPRDMERALDYLESAANKGQPQSYNVLGSVFDEGTCVDRDPFKARQFYARGVAAGDAVALKNLTLLEAKERANGTKGWIPGDIVEGEEEEESEE